MMIKFTSLKLSSTERFQSLHTCIVIVLIGTEEIVYMMSSQSVMDLDRRNIDMVVEFLFR